LGERPTKPKVTCLPGEEFLPENIQPTFRSGRQSIMVWACITHNWKGPIIRLNLVPEKTTAKDRKTSGGLDGPRYVDQILKGPLKEFLDLVEKEEGVRLLVVEDGTPSHHSVVVKKAKIELGIQNLDHPPSLPDLNPIEPLWLVLKNRVADESGSQNTLDALWAAVQKVWDEITIEEIQKHTGKMQDCIDAVKEAKGWHTRF